MCGTKWSVTLPGGCAVFRLPILWPMPRWCEHATNIDMVSTAETVSRRALIRVSLHRCRSCGACRKFWELAVQVLLDRREQPPLKRRHDLRHTHDSAATL